MELVTALPPDTPLAQIPTQVRRIERLGCDTVHIPETVHDSLAVALLAVEHSTRLTVRTSSWRSRVARWSRLIRRGSSQVLRRTVLALATQVRGNIEDRLSVSRSYPAGQPADYLRSLRAIFAAFRGELPLSYHGEHYRFDRLQPYFNPGGRDVDPPELWTGGVNPRVCSVAGKLADGFVTHATNSHPRFLREHCLPAVADGTRHSNRRDGGPRVVVVSKCITGPNRRALTEVRAAARREFAFLYSTPAYRPTLDLLGHRGLGRRLTGLVREKQWSRLPETLTDRVLAELVPQATYRELPAVLHRWYAGLADGLAVLIPAEERHDIEVTEMLSEIREIPTAHRRPSETEGRKA